jgi:hypothetical protein
MKCTENDLFSTYDLNITACMVALGHSIEKIQKQGGGRCQFFFKRSDKLKDDVIAYWKQAVLVNPHALFDALKFMKSRIYAGDID